MVKLTENIRFALGCCWRAKQLQREANSTLAEHSDWTATESQFDDGIKFWVKFVAVALATSNAIERPKVRQRICKSCSLLLQRKVRH